MEYEVSAGSHVRELELPFYLLDLLQPVLNEYLVLAIQIGEYLDVDLVSCLLKLHLSKRGGWLLPLELLEFDVSRSLIEGGLGINDPSCGQNDEARLGRAESVLL